MMFYVALSPHRSILRPASDIEVQSELPRMGTEPDGIDLMLSLVLKPGRDHVLGKHIPL